MGTLHTRQIKGVGNEDFSRGFFCCCFCFYFLNLCRNIVQCHPMQSTMHLFLFPYVTEIALAQDLDYRLKYALFKKYIVLHRIPV